MSGAEPLGIHLEGPFINNKRRGAQDQNNIRIVKRDDEYGQSHCRCRRRRNEYGHRRF